MAKLPLNFTPTLTISIKKSPYKAAPTLILLPIQFGSMCSNLLISSSYLGLYVRSMPIPWF